MLKKTAVLIASAATIFNMAIANPSPSEMGTPPIPTEAESRTLDLNYEQCQLLISATESSSSISAQVRADTPNFKMYAWEMDDGEVFITCDKKGNDAIMSLKPLKADK